MKILFERSELMYLKLILQKQYISYLDLWWKYVCHFGKSIRNMKINFLFDYNVAISISKQKCDKARLIITYHIFINDNIMQYTQQEYMFVCVCHKKRYKQQSCQLLIQPHLILCNPPEELFSFYYNFAQFTFTARMKKNHRRHIDRQGMNNMLVQPLQDQQKAIK